MIDFIADNGIIACRASNPFDRTAQRVFADWFGEIRLAYLRCGRFSCIIPEDNSGIIVGREFDDLPALPSYTASLATYRSAVLTRLAHVERALKPTHPLRSDVLADIAAERSRIEAVTAENRAN